MTGEWPLRMTRACRAGSWLIISGVSTGWRVWWFWPCSRTAAVPQRIDAASSAWGSVMPGSQILAPEVSMMTRAPSAPQRDLNWASPWATVMIWMPLPPESASQDGTGTGQIWVTSSRAMSRGGSRRPPGIRLPARQAV